MIAGLVRRWAGAWFATLLAVAAAVPAGAQVHLSPSVGAFGIFQEQHIGEVGLELRLPVHRKLRPILGGMMARGRMAYCYAGIRREFDLGKRWFLSPSVAVGAYTPGDGVDLGSALEFRSAIELGFSVTPGTHLAMTFYHLSNAGLTDRNPGSESLVVAWSAPLRRLRGRGAP